ncbi:MAG: helix-turn-helix domain-containing protein [Ruminococcus sp.]|nr:helix-turn-helix domain-containing protein [Ruminococcus sp.]
MKENFTMSTNIPEMLGIKETAERFGISQNYARQLALTGAVKAVRIGGRSKILINAQSMADFFNNSYIKVENPAQTGDIKPIPVKL